MDVAAVVIVISVVGVVVNIVVDCISVVVVVVVVKAGIVCVCLSWFEWTSHMFFVEVF